MSQRTCTATEEDGTGNLTGCVLPATGWRLTYDGHLEPACVFHGNPGGERLARAEADVARLREQKLAWKRRALKAEAEG